MKHIILSLIIAVLSSTLASAEPVRVHFSPNSRDSLQTVVDRLNDGDVLIIEPGNYQLEQPVTIRRNIAIVGSREGMPTIRGRNGCFRIDVTQRTGDQRVTLGNLELIVNSGRTDGNLTRYAIAVWSGTVRIVQCELTSDGGGGLFVRGNRSRAEIVRSRVFQCAQDGIYYDNSATGLVEETEISANRRGGIFLHNGANVSISNSQIFNNGSGISMQQGSQVTINDCRIENNGESDSGISVRSRSNATISNSHVLNNSERGINIQEDSRATINNCRIENSAESGIFVTSRSNVTVSNSQISNNRYGVHVQNGGRGTFEGNRLQGNSQDWSIANDAGEVVRRNNTPR